MSGLFLREAFLASSALGPRGAQRFLLLLLDGMGLGAEISCTSTGWHQDSKVILVGWMCANIPLVHNGPALDSCTHWDLGGATREICLLAEGADVC